MPVHLARNMHNKRIGSFVSFSLLVFFVFLLVEKYALSPIFLASTFVLCAMDMSVLHYYVLSVQIHLHSVFFWYD